MQRDFEAAFEKADVLVCPSAPTTAFRLGEKLDDPLSMYLYDVYTFPANLAGIPGMSLPCGLAPEAACRWDCRSSLPHAATTGSTASAQHSSSCSSSTGTVRCSTVLPT